jgi:hypothetical protein
MKNTSATCDKCAFFDLHSSGAQPATNDGLCRFNPPVTQPGPKDHGLWPVVSNDDWCGHFAPGSVAVAAE